MDNIQEIERLHALKEKGVLSQEEFEGQKAQLLSGAAKPKPGSAKRWWKISLALIGFGVGITFFYGAISTLNGTAGSASGVTCDSDAAKDTLKHAFDLSQFARTLNLSAVEVSAPIEQRHDAKTGARSCKGDISMNNASVAHVIYKIEPRPNGQFMVTFEVDDNNTPPESSRKSTATDSPAAQRAEAVTVAPAKQIAAPEPAAPPLAVEAPQPQTMAQENIAVEDKFAFLSKYSVSFDCARASNFAEQAVCSNVILGQLDGLLLATYQSRLLPEFRANREWMRKKQMIWLSKRNACTDAACITQTYKDRIGELCEMQPVSGVHADSDCDRLPQ
ncbi:putative oligomerization/nucleic acid binding protein [Collimonas sp. PA-H2]|nr:putative oligomerization/nucleic acid binding protein [Collimonas sp. PA-H2]